MRRNRKLKGRARAPGLGVEDKLVVAAHLEGRPRVSGDGAGLSLLLARWRQIVTSSPTTSAAKLSGTTQGWPSAMLRRAADVARVDDGELRGPLGDSANKSHP